jgi:hypothetical protein
MESSLNSKINSAFRFGYICSLIENDFDLVFKKPSNDLELFTIRKNLKTLQLFKDDYKNIFNEEILLLRTYRNENDIREYLTAFINFTKNKISESVSGVLELAYFAGASLGLTFEENLEIFDHEKINGIYKLLFNLTGNTAALYSVDDTIINLMNEDVCESLLARNYLLMQFIDENVTEEQKNAFRQFDRILIKKF